MSEIKKNIETCRGEDVLAEVSAAPQDPHFGSLVNEAFDPMQQQALHQAGYDGYSEVIEQHKPYTFASAIIQMKSNLLLLLRALWLHPFGSGNLRSLSDAASLRSLADMWQHYITRLSGNETYGIPSRLSSLTDLPSAPLLFADRKISGVPEAADGISLVNLTCSSAYSDITEIIDSNKGWTLKRSLNNLRTIFPNATKYELGCSEVPHINVIDCGNEAVPIIRFGEDCYINAGTSSHYISMILNNAAEEITLRFKKAIWYCGDECGFLKGCSNVKKLTIEDCEYLDIERLFYSPTPALEELRIPILKYWYNTRGRLWYAMSDMTKLRIVEVGHMETSFNLSIWKPDSTILDGGNNQALFLSNFRTYIALRLTDNGSGLTLTLSQAVYDAIKDESHLFVFDEGTMTIYAYLTNIKHWTVTK